MKNSAMQNSGLFHFPVLMSIILPLVLMTACRQSPPPRSENEIAAFHQSLYTIDTHTDTPYLLLREGTDLSVRNQPLPAVGKIDIPRMDEGGLDGVFFAVYIRQEERTRENTLAAREKALTLFDSIRSFIRQNNRKVELAVAADDLYRIAGKGRHAIYIGMENGFPVGTDLSMVEEFYRMGARYITLCHSSNNDICDSSTDPEGPEHGGLSEFGKEVVREMNRLGMMVDVSHVSDESFFDVLNASRAPVIASHSNARAVCGHPRNLSDSMLLALARDGGVIQVCLVNDYVREVERNPARDSAKKAVFARHGDYFELAPEARKAFMADWTAVDSLFPAAVATVSDLVDHVDHIVELAGVDHVGIGTDFDGGAELKDCYDVSQIGNITAELIRRGYSRGDIRKIWSGNFIRVMKQVEDLRETASAGS